MRNSKLESWAFALPTRTNVFRAAGSGGNETPTSTWATATSWDFGQIRFLDGIQASMRLGPCSHDWYEPANGGLELGSHTLEEHAE